MLIARCKYVQESTCSLLPTDDVSVARDLTREALDGTSDLVDLADRTLAQTYRICLSL